MPVTCIESRYTQQPSGEVSPDLAAPLGHLDVVEVGRLFLPDFFDFLFISRDTKEARRINIERGLFELVKPESIKSSP